MPFLPIQSATERRLTRKVTDRKFSDELTDIPPGGPPPVRPPIVPTAVPQSTVPPAAPTAVPHPVGPRQPESFLELTKLAGRLFTDPIEQGIQGITNEIQDPEGANRERRERFNDLPGLLSETADPSVDAAQIAADAFLTGGIRTGVGAVGRQLARRGSLASRAGQAAPGSTVPPSGGQGGRVPPGLPPEGRFTGPIIEQGPPRGNIPGALDQARKAFDAPPHSSKGRIGDFYRKWQEQTTDTFAGINRITTGAKNAWRATNPGRRFPVEVDAELHAALSRGANNAGAQRAVDTYKKATAALDDVAEADLNVYLSARHGDDVARLMGDQRVVVGGVRGTVGAESILRQLSVQLGPERWSKLLRSASIMRDHYSDLLARKVRSGLVSPELAKELKDRYPWYNPIRYIETELTGTLDNTFSGRALSVERNDLKRLGQHGLETARESPTDLLVRATINSENLIRRNDAARAIIATARRNPETSSEIRRLTARRPKRLRQGGQAPGELLVGRVGQGKGAISYMDNGIKTSWEVPQWLEREANLLGHVPPNSFEQFGRVVNFLPRAMFTGLNPAFFTSNLIFDTLTVMLRDGVLPHRVAVSLIRSLKNIVSQDAVLARMVREGGSVTGFRLNQEGVSKSALLSKGHIPLRDLRKDWKFYLKGPHRLVDELGLAFEMAPRRAVFLAKSQQGASGPEAALAARRATVDFQRAGSAIRHANNFLLYLNPAIQGSLLPARSMLFDRPASRWRFGMFVASVAGIYAWNRQFPEYRDVPARDKFGKIIIMLPSDETDRRGQPKPRYMAILPAAREFSAMSGPLQYILGKMDDNTPEDFTEMLKSLGYAANPAAGVFPFEGGGIPTVHIAEQMTELAVNRDIFRGRPIVPTELQGLPSEQQFNERTSETARRLGGILNWSPMKIDHVLRGGVGRDILNGVDQAILALDPQAPDPRIDSIVAEIEQFREIWSKQGDVLSRYESQRLRELDPETRELVEEELRRPDPGIPFVDSIVSRFNRRGGNQLFTSGERRAAEALGTSVEQTEQARTLLSKVYDEFYSSQQRSDALVDSGEMTRKQWRDARSDQGAMYRGALLAAQVILPQAAQVKGADDWQRYRQMVYTLAGSIQDRRTEAEILAAGWRSITPNETVPGVIDFLEFQARRDQYLSGLSATQRKLLNDELDLTRTDMEREFERDTQTLRPYWEAGRGLIEPRRGEARDQAIIENPSLYPILLKWDYRSLPGETKLNDIIRAMNETGEELPAEVVAFQEMFSEIEQMLQPQETPSSEVDTFREIEEMMRPR